MCQQEQNNDVTPAVFKFVISFIRVSVETYYSMVTNPTITWLPAGRDDFRYRHLSQSMIYTPYLGNRY